MKKILSAALALAMTLSMVPAAFAAGGTAYASTQIVEVDGKKVEFQMYALKDAAGNPTNYVKLRDVAHVLNGTKAQFSVGYDGSISVTTGQPYADAGGEMTTPYSGDRAYRDGSGSVKVNGQSASLESIILTDDAGGDYTYFKLRDLGAALGFTVDWSADRGVFLNTGGSTQPANPLDLFQGAWKGSFQLDDGETVFEEIIFTGDQFERAQRRASRDRPTYFRGTVLVQENMVNSGDGKTYPYVLTITTKERLNNGTMEMEQYDSVGYYYVQSVDSGADRINWKFSSYDRMNSTDAAALHAIFQGVPAAEDKPNSYTMTTAEAYNKLRSLYNKELDATETIVYSIGSVSYIAIANKYVGGADSKLAIELTKLRNHVLTARSYLEEESVGMLAICDQAPGFEKVKPILLKIKERLDNIQAITESSGKVDPDELLAQSEAIIGYWGEFRDAMQEVYDKYN